MNHSGDGNEVQERPDPHDTAGEEPHQPGRPPSQIKPVESQNPEAPEKPEKIRDPCALHSTSLGTTKRIFLVKSARWKYLLILQCRVVAETPRREEKPYLQRGTAPRTPNRHPYSKENLFLLWWEISK